MKVIICVMLALLIMWAEDAPATIYTVGETETRSYCHSRDTLSKGVKFSNSNPDASHDKQINTGTRPVVRCRIWGETGDVLIVTYTLLVTSDHLRIGGRDVVVQNTARFSYTSSFDRDVINLIRPTGGYDCGPSTGNHCEYSRTTTYRMTSKCSPCNIWLTLKATAQHYLEARQEARRLCKKKRTSCTKSMQKLANLPDVPSLTIEGGGKTRLEVRRIRP